MGRGGQGAYIRIQNKSTQIVTVKLIEGRNIEDAGLDKLEGVLKPHQQLPAQGKALKSGHGTYQFIEGEVRNRMQKDGFFSLEAHPKNGKPCSKLQLVVDHDSWECKDTSPDRESSVLLVADIGKDEDDDDDFKIELRIFDNFNPCKWMEEYGEKHGLGEKPLCHIGLPGTHDSGTYRFDKDKGASPDSGLTQIESILDRGRLLGKMNDWILEQIFERMCRCQTLSIRQQLEQGIRYIDMRVAFHADSGTFMTCHGVFCVDVKEILQDINGFLNENPKEIVIVEFKKLYGLGEKENIALSKMILSTLDDKLAVQAKCAPNAPVKSYWNKGYQAIVLYQDGPTVQKSGGKLWPLQQLISPWPEAGSTKKLHTVLREKVASRDPTKFFCAQGILTPDAEVIKREIMDGDGLSIKKLSQKCSGKVVDWVEDEWKPSNQLNIVIVDFTEIGNLVPAVISYNHK